MQKSNSNFLRELQIQAKLQSRLQNEELLPRQFKFFSAIIGNYPWQFLLVISGLTAVVLEVLESMGRMHGAI